MPKQMECSEEPCVRKMILIPARDNVPNNRDAMPTTPTIPVPSMRSTAISEIEEIPLISLLDFPESLETKVPGCSGLKVFLIISGIFLI